MGTRLCLSSLPGFAVMIGALSGCGGDSTTPARIQYHQVGLCNVYTTPGGERPTKPNEVYVVYKIEDLDNSKRSAVFTFLPNRLYVDQTTAKQQAEMKQKEFVGNKPMGTPDWFNKRNLRRFAASDTSFAQAMGTPAVVPAVIPSGGKLVVNGFTVVPIVVPEETGAGEVDKTFYALSYDALEGDGDSIPADPPIVLTNTNPAQTTWPHPDNCQALTPEKLAS
jgi:hypothetical protein